MNDIPGKDYTHGLGMQNSLQTRRDSLAGSAFLSTARCSYDVLTKADKSVIGLIANGNISAACALGNGSASRKDSPALSAEGPGLADRLREGEALLRCLGLVGSDHNENAASVRTGLVVLRSPSADRAVIVFNGNSAMLSLPYPLAANADVHIIILRDPSRCFGFLGIPGLGSNYEACLANLRRLVAALGVEECYCVGLSAGGSTAIRMGCDLGVNGVLGFSVPTTLDLSDEDGAELKDYPQLTRLYNYGRQFGIDLTKYYAGKSPRPQMMLVYSAAHERDRWLAERTRGIPGIELLEVEGYGGHATYRWLQESRALDPLFERLFTLDEVE
jgi:hypothetical protein